METVITWICSFCNQSFWQNFVANAFAVALGIPAGLWLNHLTASWSAKRQRTQLRSALKRALEHNLGTLATVREQIQGQIAPTFTLDLALLDATAHTKYDVLGDVDLCTAIDHLRFEMAHLDRQIDALLRLVLDTNARVVTYPINGNQVTHFDLHHPQLVNMIQTRLPPLEKECKEILDKLKDGK